MARGKPNPREMGAPQPEPGKQGLSNQISAFRLSLLGESGNAFDLLWERKTGQHISELPREKLEREKLNNTPLIYFSDEELMTKINASTINEEQEGRWRSLTNRFNKPEAASA